MNYKLIGLLLLAGLVVLFIVQNVATVEIQFLFWSTQMPRSLMIFLIFAVGILVGWFLHGFLALRRNLKGPDQAA